MPRRRVSLWPLVADFMPRFEDGRPGQHPKPEFKMPSGAARPAASYRAARRNAAKAQRLHAKREARKHV